MFSLGVKLPAPPSASDFAVGPDAGAGQARARSPEDARWQGFSTGRRSSSPAPAGGIGRACALGCAAEGAKVVVADIGVGLAGEDPTSAVAEAVVKEIEAAGGEAVAVAQDVSTMAGGEAIVNTAVERWGRIDGVVAVAGILRERMLFNMSEDEWDAVIATHLKGHFTVFRHAAAVMRKQESGSLIGFTSGAFAGQRGPGQLLRGQGRDRLARTFGGRGAVPLRRAGQRHRPHRPDADVGQRALGVGRERAIPRTSPPWSSTCCRTGEGRHRPGVHGGRLEDRRVEPAGRGARDATDGRWTPEDDRRPLRRGRGGADGGDREAREDAPRRRPRKPNEEKPKNDEVRFSYAESMTDPAFYCLWPGRPRRRDTTPSSSPTSISYPEHPMTIYPFNPDGTREFLEDKPFLEPFSLIPALGAVTSTIRFVTFVIKLPIRHPVLVAKQVASVAVLTGNRLVLGVGTSPWPEDYQLLDVPWEGRGKRMDESIAIIRGFLPAGTSSSTARCLTCPR